jgi:Ca2+-binding RTX toxin-like protein
VHGVITLERTTDVSSGSLGKPWSYVDREYVNDGTLYATAQIFRTFWDAGVNGGGQHVAGVAGAQVLQGGATNDMLWGGAGADTFLFAGTFGQDRIGDFLDGTDKLDMTALGIDTLAELEAAASLTNASLGLVVDFGGGQKITITGLTVATLGDADFA